MTAKSAPMRLKSLRPGTRAPSLSWRVGGYTAHTPRAYLKGT